MNEWLDISCPAGCDTPLLFGAVPEDQNCVEIPNLSQVCDLYIWPNGATDAFDYTGGDPVLVAGAIDNTDTTNTKTKWLVGIGGVAEPQTVEFNGPKGSLKIIKRIYTLDFQVNVRDTNQRNLLRQLQCNPNNFKFRYGTLGGQLFGGSTAITPSFSDAIFSLGSGNEDYELARIIIRWQVSSGYGDPPRHPNPHSSV